MNHVEYARISLLPLHVMQDVPKETVGMCQHATKLDGITLLQISTNKDCQHHDQDISEFKSPYTAQIHSVLSYAHLTTLCPFHMVMYYNTF
jgi:hypothetical protein